MQSERTNKKNNNTNANADGIKPVCYVSRHLFPLGTRGLIDAHLNIQQNTLMPYTALVFIWLGVIKTTVEN